MLPAIDKQLLFEHFADKTTPLQKLRIEEWLCVEANQEQFYAWLVEWENQSASYVPNQETSLQRFIQHMDASPSICRMADADVPASDTLDANRSFRFNWPHWGWLVAASLLIGVLFLGWQNKDAFIYKTYQTAFGETQSLQLADGSRVVLRANSSLRVPRFGFGKRTREVWLTGEAGFDVTHTADNLTFVVKTANEFEVVVLGTEFTVFARQRGARVQLNKGKVQLHYQENQLAKQVLMKPGDLVTLDSKNHIALKTRQQTQLHPTTEENRFVFEETTLEEVAYRLQENYGLQVDIKNRALAERVLMGSFQADNVDQLLQSISELLDINVVRQGNQVQITDK